VPTYAKPFLKQALDSHLIVALDDDERVIGALCFRRCTRERLADWTPSAHVTFTLVAADHRGEGVARSLNERFVNDAAPRLPEVTHITRETWSENRASRSYIESMGFDEVDRIPDDRTEHDT
jgi:ribosomal protein S18 acetylase RimI-like enzyme